MLYCNAKETEKLKDGLAEEMLPLRSTLCDLHPIVKASLGIAGTTNH